MNGDGEDEHVLQENDAEDNLISILAIQAWLVSAKRGLRYGLTISQVAFLRPQTVCEKMMTVHPVLDCKVSRDLGRVHVDGFLSHVLSILISTELQKVFQVVAAAARVAAEERLGRVARNLCRESLIWYVSKCRTGLSLV